MSMIIKTTKISIRKARSDRIVDDRSVTARYDTFQLHTPNKDNLANIVCKLLVKRSETDQKITKERQVLTVGTVL